MEAARRGGRVSGCLGRARLRAAADPRSRLPGGRAALRARPRAAALRRQCAPARGLKRADSADRVSGDAHDHAPRRRRAGRVRDPDDEREPPARGRCPGQPAGGGEPQARRHERPTRATSGRAPCRRCATRRAAYGLPCLPAGDGRRRRPSALGSGAGSVTIPSSTKRRVQQRRHGARALPVEVQAVGLEPVGMAARVEVPVRDGHLRVAGRRRPDHVVHREVRLPLGPQRHPEHALARRGRAWRAARPRCWPRTPARSRCIRPRRSRCCRRASGPSVSSSWSTVGGVVSLYGQLVCPTRRQGASCRSTSAPRGRVACASCSEAIAVDTESPIIVIFGSAAAEAGSCARRRRDARGDEGGSDQECPSLARRTATHLQMVLAPGRLKRGLHPGRAAAGRAFRPRVRSSYPAGEIRERGPGGTTPPSPVRRRVRGGVFPWQPEP